MHMSCVCLYVFVVCAYACIRVYMCVCRACMCVCEMCTWGKKISFAPIANPRIYVAKGYFW